MAGAVGLALERGIIRPLESLFATWGVSLVLQQVFRHSWLLTRTSLSLDFCLDVGDSFYIMVRGAIVAKGPITDPNQDIVKQHYCMKNCQLSVLGVVALILSTGQHVYAHPGHGLGDHGVAHVVSSPFHVAALLAVALGCWGAAWFVSHTLGRRLLRFGAVAAFFGAAVAWSVMT